MPFPPSSAGSPSLFPFLPVPLGDSGRWSANQVDARARARLLLLLSEQIPDERRLSFRSVLAEALARGRLRRQL